MKKIIVWMLAMAMMLSLLAGCSAKQEMPTEPETEPESNVQETEEATTGELILEEDVFPDTEETEAPTQMETEPEETTVPATEAVSTETQPEEIEIITLPPDIVDQTGGIALPEDEFE